MEGKQLFEGKYLWMQSKAVGEAVVSEQSIKVDLRDENTVVFFPNLVLFRIWWQ